jgi:hypothetical protein
VLVNNSIALFKNQLLFYRICLSRTLTLDLKKDMGNRRLRHKKDQMQNLGLTARQKEKTHSKKGQIKYEILCF